MFKFRYIVILGFVLGLIGALASCGGSGGDGIPELVPVTSDNSEALAREAYMGRGGADMDEIMGQVGGDMDENESVSDALDSLFGDSDLTFSQVAAMGSGTYAFDGSCDGTATINYAFKGLSSVSATLIFDQFNDSGANCDEGLVIDGQIKGSANYTYDEENDDIDLYSAKVTFSHASVAYGGNEYLMDGTMEYTASAGDEHTVTVNATVSYVNDSYNVELIGYVDRFSYDDETGATTENVSGIFVSSQIGAVRIGTDVSVVTYDDEGYPSSGTLVITGASTDLGNSSAKVVFGENATFTVSCDEDGDGVYEWESGQLAW